MLTQKQRPRLSGDVAIFSSLVAITNADACGAGACSGVYWLVDRDSPNLSSG